MKKPKSKLRIDDPWRISTIVDKMLDDFIESSPAAKEPFWSDSTNWDDTAEHKDKAQEFELNPELIKFSNSQWDSSSEDSSPESSPKSSPITNNFDETEFPCGDMFPPELASAADASYEYAQNASTPLTDDYSDSEMFEPAIGGLQLFGIESSASFIPPSKEIASKSNHPPYDTPVITCADPEDISTDSMITFYQRFRAGYPKLTQQTNSEICTSAFKSDPATLDGKATGNGAAGPIFNFASLSSTAASSSSRTKPTNIGLGLVQRYGILANSPTQSPQPRSMHGRPLDVFQREKRVEACVLKNSSSLMNITRLFNDLLSERDSALLVSESLESERNSITNSLGEVEEVLLEMQRQKKELSAQLKSVVEREIKVNTVLDGLDSRISQITQETYSYETRFRNLKSDSKISIEVSPDIEKGCLMSLYGHIDCIETISAEHPFGHLISGSIDKTARVYDLSTGQCRAILKGHKGWVRSSCIRDSIAITGSNDSLIKIWNISYIPESERREEQRGVIGKRQSAACFVATSDDDSTLDFDDNEEVSLRVYSGTLAGHTGGVSCMWFEDGVLCSGSVDKTIRHWDIETGKCINVLRSERWVDRDSGLCQTDSMIYGGLEDLEFPFNSASIPGAADSRSQYLNNITIPEEHTTHLWNRSGSSDSPSAYSHTPQGRRRFSLFSTNESAGDLGFMMYNVGGQVGALQFWQHALAAGYGDGIIRLFDLRSGECNRMFDGFNGAYGNGHNSAITCLQFNDTTIVTGSSDKSIKIWDLRNGEVLDTIVFTSGVTSVSFDQRRIVAAAGTRQVQLYNRSSGLLTSLGDEEGEFGWSGHSKPVRSVVCCGERIISAGMDSVVKIWKE